MAAGPGQRALDAATLVQPATLPWLRETSYGSTLGFRGPQQGPSGPGPSDLLHLGRFFGERLRVFHSGEFAPASPAAEAKELDGYVGFYHYSNGVDFAGGPAAVESHVTRAIGLERDGPGAGSRSGTPVSPGPETTGCESDDSPGYVWLESAVGGPSPRPVVATFCAFNAVARAELRARFLVAKTRGRRVAVSAEYFVTFQLRLKLYAYTRATVGQLVAHAPHFWAELAALTLVRALAVGNSPALQHCGTATLADQVASRPQLEAAVGRLVAQLPRGSVLGTSPRHSGPAVVGPDGVRALRHRNNLLDALVLLVALDGSGGVAAAAADRISAAHGREFDYAVCRVLQAAGDPALRRRFLAVVHRHTQTAARLCQTALLLVEQARFLVAQGLVLLALLVAARAVELLPLDFDAWHVLALCHVLAGDAAQAFAALNTLPVVFQPAGQPPPELDGGPDLYARVYVQRPIGLRTFERMFPEPTVGGREAALVAQIWHAFEQPYQRHPGSGPFLQTPLLAALAWERLTVDGRLARLVGTNTAKLQLAARSAGRPWLLLLDFDAGLTWGRAYDLLTLFVAVFGWLEAVACQQRGPQGRTLCLWWLEQMLGVAHDDLAVVAQMAQDETERSGLAWRCLGLVGWLCKYSLRESILLLATGTLQGFDYFGAARMLHVYYEFVLSDVHALAIDPFAGLGGACLLNKLLVHHMRPDRHRHFVAQLLGDHFSLERIVLLLAKLVLWCVRWYTYMPLQLVAQVVLKLCWKHDPLAVRLALRIAFSNGLRQQRKVKPAASFRAMFAAPEPDVPDSYDFVEGDTIMEYMDGLILWAEGLMTEPQPTSPAEGPTTEPQPAKPAEVVTT